MTYHRAKRPLKSMGWLVHLVCLTWLLAFPTGKVHAQSNTTDNTAFQLQQFRPWNDPYGILQTQSGETMGQWKWMVGAFFNYSHVPLRLLERQKNGTDAVFADLISHQIAADINIAIGLANFLDIGLQIPITLYQIGKFPNDSIFGDNSNRDISGFYLGDIKLGIKFRFLSEKANGVGLGLQIWGGFPTAQIGPKKFFNGEELPTIGAGLLFNKTISILTLGINLGYRLNHRTEFVSIVVSHELYYSLGVALALVPKKFDLLFDFAGAANFTEAVSLRGAPLDAYIAARIFPLNNQNLALNIGVGLPLSPGYGSPLFRVFFGLSYTPREIDTDGDGLLDPVDRCPKVKGPRENVGCPWPDTDKDGLLDKDDRCPRTPGPKANQGCPWNDRDGDGLIDPQDRCPRRPGPKANQGCPWPDSDGDGIIDPKDRCPNDPGPKANKGCPWPDTDGDGLLDKDDKCPKQPGPKSNRGCPLVVINQKVRRIYILKKIFFAFNKASIKPESYPVLDAVANILNRYKSIHIRIEGHTDDVGSRSYNRKLSKRRAASVRRYLSGKGISLFRMRSRGYGESRPLAGGPRRFTKTQRAKNRRVEFHITRQ